jgi:hypothetical protein
MALCAGWFTVPFLFFPFFPLYPIGHPELRFVGPLGRSAAPGPVQAQGVSAAPAPEARAERSSGKTRARTTFGREGEPAAAPQKTSPGGYAAARGWTRFTGRH